MKIIPFTKSCSDADLETRMSSFQNLLADADAILIGAGAGLSVAAGLEYAGKEFEKEFSDFIAKYHFEDLYTSGFFNFPTEEERWAYWAKHIDFIRFASVKPLYKQLYDLIKNKEYFIITTNVDAQFRKAGFDTNRLFEVQGDYGKMQCATACHNTTYDNEQIVKRMVCQIEDCAIPSALVPVCPVCGGPMEINIRKDRYFVQDYHWEESARRYTRFIDSYSDKKLLLLELGVGFNTPTIIRYPFERLAYENNGISLVRFNKDYPHGARENIHKSICFSEDIEQILTRTAQK